MQEEPNKSASPVRRDKDNAQAHASKLSSTSSDLRGRHRKLAELNRLNQEIRFLEDELEELDKTEKASSACREVVFTIENTPDPLLPVTKGPANPAWDRWFEGPVETEGCKCWIF